VRAHHLEHLEDVALRLPRGDSDPSSLAADPRYLARGGLGTAGEHHAESRDDRVELTIGVAKFLGIADLVFDLESLRLADRACSVDEIRGNVDAGDPRATRCEQTRGPPGAGRQIKETLAGARLNAAHAVFERARNLAADLVVGKTAGAPHSGGTLVVRLDSSLNVSLSACVHRRLPRWLR
jgi:hypothetical protein